MDVLLLGAGASCEAGLPDSRHLTGRILAAFAEHENPTWAAILQYVVGGLLLRRATAPLREAPPPVDIEAVVRALQLLAERDASELSPFVGSWHSLVDDVERRDRQAFSNTYLQVVNQLATLLWLNDDANVDYLKPILRVAEHQKLIEIATLNFDNTIEILAHRHGVSISTGLDPQRGYNPQLGYQFSFGESGINLMKLHGSVAWTMHEPPESGAPFPAPFVLARSRPPADISRFTHTTHAVLFGARNKLTMDGPYLDLLLRFRSILATASCLTIVGYSFRDDHINAQIASYLNGSKERRIRVIDRQRIDSPFFVRMQRAWGDRCEPITATAGEGLERVFQERQPMSSESATI